jgi:signal transduction histidine kinase
MSAIKSRSLRELVRSRSPWLFLGSVGLLVFVAEVIVMVGLSHLPQLPSLLEAIVDGVCLSVLIAPALYYLLYLPLKHENHDRQLMEQELRRSGEILQDQAEQLFKYSQTLEQQVTDRTAALSAQNLKLETLLTQLHQTQAQIVQTEKMSSLGQLVAGVAHEINNPVSFIHGNLKHLQQYATELLDLVTLYEQHYPHPVGAIAEALAAIEVDFLREDIPQILQSMHHGTERIRTIVLSLRNFSRLDEAASKIVDLHEGIDSTLMLLEHRLKPQTHRAAIQITKQYGAIPSIECYVGSLNQVFMHLLNNAIDAIDAAASERLPLAPYQIKIHTECTDGDQVTITIGDNGSGIPTAIRSKLFDPFFTTRAIGKGTGLGLSTSYQIVTETHGGQLAFDSIVGQGTQFRITLPIAAAPVGVASTTSRTIG